MEASVGKLRAENGTHFSFTKIGSFLSSDRCHLDQKGRLKTPILKWILSLSLPLFLLLFTILDMIHVLLTCFYWPRKIRRKTHKG